MGDRHHRPLTWDPGQPGVRLRLYADLEQDLVGGGATGWLTEVTAGPWPRA
ncbi:DUF6207 family protein [Streptomyces sp. NPDC054794]